MTERSSRVSESAEFAATIARRRLLLGVAGSVAATKVTELAAELREHAKLRVVMTRTATRFVAPEVLADAAAGPVLLDLFGAKEAYPHVAWGRWAEGLLVAPATAGVLGRLANGGGVDALTTVALCVSPREKACLLVPAMTAPMWSHPLVERSVGILRAVGYSVMEPERGWQRCGEYGQGRLPGVQKIVSAALELLPRPTAPTLTTPDLVLRACRAQDIEQLAALDGSTQRNRVSRGGSQLLSGPDPLSAIEVQWQMEGFGLWAIEERINGRLVGSICLIEHGDWDALGPSCRVSSEFRGQGIATQAVAACARWAFEVLELPQLVWVVEADNQAAHRVAEKLGATSEGRGESRLYRLIARADAPQHHPDPDGNLLRPGRFDHAEAASKRERQREEEEDVRDR